MNVDWPKPGHYVVAVSGGVDSMALLHMLQSRPGLKLTVAHFDHGIRDDSADDRVLVEETAKSYGLPVVYEEARLGPGTSEAAARTARYRFLRQVQKASGSKAIITAHHRDDLLETAILNMLRGTGRKGLTSLSDRYDVNRLLLGVSKQELIDYAKNQGLVWHEDSTNQDVNYLRNYVRHRLLTRFNQADTARLLEIIANLATLNNQLDKALVNQLHMQSEAGKLDRSWFNCLPHKVAREVMAAWLRANRIGFDSKMLERLVVSAKTAATGKVFTVSLNNKLSVEKRYLALAEYER